MVDEPVEALEGQLAGLGDGPRAVGGARGVAEVGDRLVRQLVEDRPHDGQPAVAGVEDPDREVSHRTRVGADTDADVHDRESGASHLLPSGDPMTSRTLRRARLA